MDQYFPSLLSPGGLEVEQVTHTFWVTASVAANAEARNITTSITLTFASSGHDASETAIVPIRLRVADVLVPPLATAAFNTVFNFHYRDDGGNLTTAMKAKYFRLLCDSRTPADNTYIKDGRPIEDYRMLRKCGARQYNLLDVSAAGAGHKMQPNYTKAEVDSIVDALRPLVSSLTQAGLIAGAYVYGFDERPPSYIQGIRQVFGAVKQAFPGLRTMAVLRWAPPADSAIDVWVNLYSLWNETEAAHWRSLGGRREAWAYHCISPRPSPPTAPTTFMNTFLEYPAKDARFLSWFAAGWQVDGWLYYLVDGWSGRPGGPHSQLQHVPLTLVSGSTAKTNFSAVRYNSVAVPGQPGAFSNGDGILIYPGSAGPLSSIRLENYRDGVEDFELLALLRRKHNGSMLPVRELVGQVVTGYCAEGQRSCKAGVNSTGDFSSLEGGFEHTRRALVAALAAAD